MPNLNNEKVQLRLSPKEIVEFIQRHKNIFAMPFLSPETFQQALQERKEFALQLEQFYKQFQKMAEELAAKSLATLFFKVNKTTEEVRFEKGVLLELFLTAIFGENFAKSAGNLLDLDKAKQDFIINNDALMDFFRKYPLMTIFFNEPNIKKDAGNQLVALEKSFMEAQSFTKQLKRNFTKNKTSLSGFLTNKSVDFNKTNPDSVQKEIFAEFMTESKQINLLLDITKFNSLLNKRYEAYLIYTENCEFKDEAIHTKLCYALKDTYQKFAQGLAMDVGLQKIAQEKLTSYTTDATLRNADYIEEVNKILLSTTKEYIQSQSQAKTPGMKK